MALDVQAAAKQLIRALRGSRSQVAASRRLGYASNVLHMWETGRRWPTAAETFRLAEVGRLPISEALRGWYRTPPAWLAEVDLTAPSGVARFLQHEQGDTPIVALAARSGFNRYSVSRWIRGDAEPRLPEFLALVEAMSLRVVDLLARWVGPQRVPAVADLWAQREARRNAVIEEPWSQGVLRALDLADVRAAPESLARRLGIPEERVASALAALERAGQVRRVDGQLEPVAVEALDTRRTEETARRLKGFWAEVAAERLVAGTPGDFAYNVFSVSRGQLRRLQEMQAAYWRAVRAVVAEDEPPEVVALLNLQLLRLDRDVAEEDNP